MKTKLNKAEKKVVTLECLLVVLSLVALIFGIIQILNGSLLAILWSTIVLYITCLVGEDVQRIWDEAKRRDGNA